MKRPNRLADTVLRSCSPAAGAIIPTSGLQEAEDIRQLVPGTSTNIIQQNFLQVQQQFGDVTVEGARNLTIGGTQNIGKPGPSQGEDKQLTWTEKLRERTKSRIHEWTNGMVKTSALMTVMNKLNSGATWVTIRENPGEGKTTTAFMALEELHRSGRQVFQVISPKEFSEVVATCPNSVIMLDDIFGKLVFNQAKWSKWEPVLQQVLGGTEHRSHEQCIDVTKEKDVTVLLIGRDYVLKSASSDMGRMSDYFTCDTHVVNMSNTVQRDIREKRAIWKVISEAGGIELDEQTLDGICDINVPHGFPHVCRLFVTMYKEDTNIDAESFFQAPLKFLNQTVQKLINDKVKLLLFKEIIKRNGTVNIHDLENVDNVDVMDIIDVANSLVGTYLSKEDGNFTFNHPSIYDSVAFNICKNFPLFVIQNCHLSFLYERLRLDPLCHTRHDTSSSESSLVINIPRCYITELAKRFAAEIENRNLIMVLSHKALSDKVFIQELMCHVTLPLNRILKMTDRQRKQSFLSLVASSKSSQLLKFIERDMQLSESEIKTVLHEVWQCAASDVLTYLVQTRDTLDINGRYENDQTPLMIASGSRDIQFVQKIMSLGPDMNARDRWGKTAFHYCCENGLDTVVKQEIVLGTDINLEDYFGRSPLHWACQYNQLDVVRLLLDKEAQFDAHTVEAACQGGSLDVLMLLFEKGATVNIKTLTTSLATASLRGHIKVMSFLIDKGASVNALATLGWPLLHDACYWNKPRSVHCLLEHGAEIAIRDDHGHTPLHIAAGNESKECADVLLKDGADVTVQNMDGDLPLHIAAERGSGECVLLLLKAGAVIDTTNRQGQTPLHKAVFFSNIDDSFNLPDLSLCTTLISHGAVINKKDTEGNTPLHLLSQVESYTQIFSEKDFPYCCRHPAFVHKDLYRSLVTIFVDHGADREIMNNRGELALRGWCKTLIDDKIKQHKKEDKKWCRLQ